MPILLEMIGALVFAGFFIYGVIKYLERQTAKKEKDNVDDKRNGRTQRK